MSLRYEVTPGAGLVARHADSLVWVGDEISPQTWEAIGTVLDLDPGADPSGADTAERLSALNEALSADPTAVFAALIIAGGQAQGILRGPVTVRNRDEIAPATGYEQYGITVPFPMSEAVYVGNVNASENPAGISDMLDLDAGIVPGGGAWAHPISGGRRHHGAIGAHGAPSAPGTDGVPAAHPAPADPTSAGPAPADSAAAGPAAATAEGLGAAGAAGALGAAGAAAGIAAATGAAEAPAANESSPSADFHADPNGPASGLSEQPPADEATPPLAGASSDQLDATVQYDPQRDADDAPPAGAAATSSPEPSEHSASPAPTDSAARPAPSADSELGWPQPEPPQPSRPVSDWIPSESPADPDAGVAVPSPTGDFPPDVRADAPLPPVEVPGGGSAAPVGFGGAAAPVGFGAAGAAETGGPGGGAPPADGQSDGFSPAPDHERVDLQSVAAAEPAQPLPPVDSAAPGQGDAQGAPAPQPAAQNPGAIIFDDGSSFALDRDYVIGRRPEKDPRVVSGHASPLTVVDPDTVLSSAHALVTRRGDRVFLQDLGSLNGSHTAAPGESDWTRLGTHEEIQIVPGTRLLFGWTVATFSGGDQQA